MAQHKIKYLYKNTPRIEDLSGEVREIRATGDILLFLGEDDKLLFTIPKSDFLGFWDHYYFEGY